MTALALAALGSAIGSVLRYLASRGLDRDPAQGGWPLGTLAVNLVGSLVIGAVGALGLGVAATTLLATGLCGGLTTYSSFAVQSHALLRSRPAVGAAYVVVSLGGGLLAAWIGWTLAG